ncbi:hypothetical protein BJY04DRAFT_203889 [Aspergillus karnatakaensis]|uniref:uncharacterized protein n=1 Tax=Aspergillus karnatakaensis TaxID=1810916 RepID=UPI003CCD91C6
MKWYTCLNGSSLVLAAVIETGSAFLRPSTPRRRTFLTAEDTARFPNPHHCPQGTASPHSGAPLRVRLLHPWTF